MFGIGGWEFVLIAVLALLLFGPDKLPQIARTLGRFMRDFKRYQDLMESTIRGEIFAADPNLQKDPFETGKAFREKVGGGGFTKPSPKPSEEPPAADVVEPDAEATAEAPVESVQVEAEGEPISAITGEIALDDDVLTTSDDAASRGEGERDEA